MPYKASNINIDLPLYYNATKQACIQNEVIFGVDIETFCSESNTNEANFNRIRKQLDVAGVYTDEIVAFSWRCMRYGCFLPDYITFDDNRTYANLMGCNGYDIIHYDTGNECMGDIATYSASTIDGANYQWTVMGGTILSGQGTPNIQIHWLDAISGNLSVEITF